MENLIFSSLNTSLESLLAIESKAATIEVKASATLGPVYTDATKNGYTPIGIIGIQAPSAALITSEWRVDPSKNQIISYFYNPTTTNMPSRTIYFRVLYIKNM